jgi:hypothetical protein
MFLLFIGYHYSIKKLLLPNYRITSNYDITIELQHSGKCRNRNAVYRNIMSLANQLWLTSLDMIDNIFIMKQCYMEIQIYRFIIGGLNLFFQSDILFFEICIRKRMSTDQNHLPHSIVTLLIRSEID